MSSNICGNCQNFRPKSGEKFFNCTKAKHAGLKYGMQVRLDTQSCEAFTPFKILTGQQRVFAPPQTPAKPLPRPLPKPKPTPPKLEPTAPISRTPEISHQPKPAPELQGTRVETPAKLKPAPDDTQELTSVSAPGAETPPQMPSTEEARRPVGLCRWGRAIFIMALAIIILVPTWIIYSCATHSTPLPTVPTPSPLPSNGVVKYFDIGEDVWATAPDRKVRISSAERVSSYLDPSGNIRQAPQGKAFIFLTVTLKNVGSTPLSTSSVDFFLTDSEGVMYQDQTYAGYQINKPYTNDASITPGIAITGKILRVVPVSASGLEVSCLLDGGSDPPVIAGWKLP